MSHARLTTQSVIMVALVLGVVGSAARAEELAVKSTVENLQAAYNGESNAKARYTGFTVKAEQEGYKKVAQLFKAAAKSEEIQARNCAATIRKLGAEPKAEMTKPEVKSTKENLETALTGEQYESETLYPAFAKKAEEEKQAGAAMNFKGAMAAEAGHAKLYRAALDSLETWKQAGPGFIVCNVCGYTTADLKMTQCVVCFAPRSKLIVVK